MNQGAQLRSPSACSLGRCDILRTNGGFFSLQSETSRWIVGCFWILLVCSPVANDTVTSVFCEVALRHFGLSSDKWRLLHHEEMCNRQLRDCGLCFSLVYCTEGTGLHWHRGNLWARARGTFLVKQWNLLNSTCCFCKSCCWKGAACLGRGRVYFAFVTR